MVTPAYDTFEQAFGACTHSADCRALVNGWCNDFDFLLCHSNSINIPADDHCVYEKGNRLAHIVKLSLSL